MSIIYTVICLCILRDFGVKATVKVIMEDITIVTVDREYFDPEKTEFHVVENEDTGETTLTTTLTIIKQLPAEAEVRLQAKSLSMGKYSTPVGIEFKMTFCEALDEPLAMGPFFAALGFSHDSCPPGPGEYFQEGYKIPYENFPDEFPENKYLVLFQISFKKKTIFASNIYLNIEME